MKREEFEIIRTKNGFSESIYAFDVLSIEQESDVLKELCKKVMKHFDEYAGLLEGIIHPDQTLASMHENSVFSESEQVHMLELFQKLMQVVRKGEYVLLEETQQIPFIVESTQVWDSVKPELLRITKKLAHSWTQTQTLKQELEYLG